MKINPSKASENKSTLNSKKGSSGYPLVNDFQITEQQKDRMINNEMMPSLKVVEERIET